MPKISVIIPVYNADKYLNYCIDSILAQTFVDFELLLINDGSNDKSEIICNEYAQIDSRVRVFHKKNEGVSSARNLGLSEALGEWITFVDADDYLCKDSLESLLNGASADLIVGGFSRIYKYSGRIELFYPEDRKINLKNDLDYFGKMIGIYLTTPWCKFFKNSIIRNNKLKFNKDLFYGEDTDFVFRYVLQIDSIQFVSKQVYCYCDNENAFVKYVLDAFHFRMLMDSTCRNFELLGKKTGLVVSELQYMFLRDYSYLYLRGVLNIQNRIDFIKEAKAYKMEKCICFTDSFKYKAIIIMINNCPCIAYLFIRLYRILSKWRLFSN